MKECVRFIKPPSPPSTITHPPTHPPTQEALLKKMSINILGSIRVLSNCSIYSTLSKWMPRWKIPLFVLTLVSVDNSRDTGEEITLLIHWLFNCLCRRSRSSSEVLITLQFNQVNRRFNPSRHSGCPRNRLHLWNELHFTRCYWVTW